ncbi:DUF1972 domain-containing protein [Fundidesulfovibrio soli]|uniref:DUF1972 domain-containing protein n=1 Tax=Fundidesulfovibrio soli TaxID=2922716 RepID=UPI001FAEC7FA|nr:DUF1972 domain-containing protein [Fundidesulfovibrio soli]
MSDAPAWRPLRIALVGTRGAPCRYGGFETCVEEVGKRLATRGHHVTLYCREHLYPERDPRPLGMYAVYLPSLRGKAVETLSHTFLSIVHSLFPRHDAHMVFNAANAPLMALYKLLGRHVALNPDGLEWKRAKWGKKAQAYYRICEKLGCLLADRLITDSAALGDYYRDVHDTDSDTVAYGAYPASAPATGRLARMGLEPRGYFLQVTRFEPENNPLLTLRAFKHLQTGKKLVLVGGCPYPSVYAGSIESEAGPSVLLPGFIYDKELLAELMGNCFAYVHGNEVGGTNPALLQAMAAGCFVMARDVLFNREVLDDCGIFFEPEEEKLAQAMGWSLEHAGELDGYRGRAMERIRTTYDWDQIALGYERTLLKIAGGAGKR